MPLIQINMMEGPDNESTRALLQAVHDAVVAWGAPAEVVRVWCNTYPPTDYMSAGVLAADKYRAS